MQENACNQNGPTPPANTSPFATVYQAVEALTSKNLNQLAQNAEKRLSKLAGGLPNSVRALADPSDYVGEAIQRVLEGEQIPGKGRKTDSRHLLSLNAFLNYLQGVVDSQISHQFESSILKGEHLSLDFEPADISRVNCPSAANVVNEVALRDTKQKLFARLRGHYENRPAFLESIQLWEQSWPADDRIPKGALNDKQVHELRVRTQLELRRLTAQDGPEGSNRTELLGL